MKKNTLYTANKYNRDAFAQYLERDKNIFWPGGSVPNSDILDDNYPYYLNPLHNAEFFIPVQEELSREDIGRNAQNYLYNSKATDFINDNPKLIRKVSPLIGNLAAGMLVSPSISAITNGAVPTILGSENIKTPFWKTDLGKGVASAAITTGSQILANKIQDKYKERKAGDIINVAAPTAGALIGSAILPGIGTAVGTGLGYLVGGAYNRLFGIKPNVENINSQKDYNTKGRTLSNAYASVRSTDALRSYLKMDTVNPNYSAKELYKKGPFSRSTKGQGLVNEGKSVDAAKNHGIWLGLQNINKTMGDQAWLHSFAYGGPFMLGSNVDPSTAIGYDFMNTYLTNRKGNDMAKGSTLNSPFAGVSSGVLGNTMAKGGKIEIKHPGRLTALKKRTGKTEKELYNDGNPAHKKMVVFARNARRWHKYAFGGYLEGQVYDISEEEAKRLIDAGYEIEYV